MRTDCTLCIVIFELHFFVRAKLVMYHSSVELMGRVNGCLEGMGSRHIYIPAGRQMKRRQTKTEALERKTERNTRPTSNMVNECQL